jgi:capsular polysaccharide biosynthesis protein
MKNYNNYFKIFKANYKFFIILPLVTLAVALLISVVQTPRYESQTALLVVQKQTATADAYTAAKASEKLGSNLAKVIYTTSFLDKVASQPDVDLSFLPADEQKRREAWKNAVTASIEPETSILKISAYAPNRDIATNLARAIAYTLANDSAEYYGGSDNISIQVVNTAITSKYPVKPNYLLNMLAGILVGLMAAVGILVIREEVMNYLPKKKAKSVKDVFPTAYKILNHETYPNYNYSVLNNSQPRSMFDHMQ